MEEPTNENFSEKKFSLYIKGVVDGMSRKVLTDAFTIFGTVKHLDVVISKKCAFVEFETEEAYQQALTQQEIDVPNLGTVYVEERKPKQIKNRAQHHRVQNHRSGSRNDIEFSLYMKGVVDGMSRDVLISAFTKFGTVKNLDVVTSKSCAFVGFETKEAYQQALMLKEIDIPNLGTVIVEERKQKNNQNNRRFDRRQKRSNYNY